jgi:transposase
MSKTGSANGSFFGNFIYDRLLQRRSHFLPDLSRTVDFSFVKPALKDFYVDWGRDPWDPVLMFKMVFLQFLYNLSDREIEEQCPWNMMCKWFLGLSAEELPPDHTTLCRFRVRLGAEGFQRLFNQVVEQARSQGFVSDRLRIIDATDSAANHAHLAEPGAAFGIIRRRRGWGRPENPAGNGPRSSASLPKEINVMASKRRGTGVWSR